MFFFDFGKFSRLQLSRIGTERMFSILSRDSMILYTIAKIFSPLSDFILLITSRM